MHIIIDQGNSFTKLAIFSGRDLQFSAVLSDTELLDLEFQKFPADSGLFSTVRSNHELISDFMRRKHLNLIPMSSFQRFPIKIAYESPDTLGTDRLADAIGAAVHFPGKNHLVVDAGTCITYNLVLDNTFYGGAISPGLSMRLAAMHHFTGRLPKLEKPDDWPSLLGKNTHDSILSGAVQGVIAEIDGMIRKFCSENGPLTVIITGGDGAYLSEHLESPIFALPFLTLTGLNEIYLHNL